MSVILALESSCDETSASVLKDGKILTNIISNQLIHSKYGGVVPEFASRAHQRNIAAVTQQAIEDSGIKTEDISAVAYTQGPGLAGSLLVAAMFAKGFALSRNIPLIGVDHLHAHIMANFIDDPKPSFPCLCLLVSGGHTQIIHLTDYLEMEIIGNTIDDAAGEAFDKGAKIMGLPYPGGPSIDLLAKSGNPKAFHFPTPKIPGYHFSFSGLKTSFLYKIRDELKKDPDFLEKNKADLCASFQHRIVTYLSEKLLLASKDTGIKEICLAGGVAANSGLRNTLMLLSQKQGWNLYVPAFQYCTDNAAMIAIAAYFRLLKGNFSSPEENIYANYRKSVK
ncbi:MAG: tRNA (adenosine(37)-N6)-threonylcarbamoyltransferase complex transferase subunit TsaD [Sphingobacteriales bacterium]|nr:tRNA (adenosine(37)-N6)-threonylcarbamoyltransferase complex transferase subunit TsaD [Sphingobacteriales bacterium]